MSVTVERLSREPQLRDGIQEALDRAKVPMIEPPARKSVQEPVVVLERDQVGRRIRTLDMSLRRPDAIVKYPYQTQVAEILKTRNGERVIALSVNAASLQGMQEADTLTVTYIDVNGKSTQSVRSPITSEKLAPILKTQNVGVPANEQRLWLYITDKPDLFKAAGQEYANLIELPEGTISKRGIWFGKDREHIHLEPFHKHSPLSSRL